MMNRQRQSAFTLLELLLALATMAIVVGVIFGTFKAGTDSARRGQAHLKRRQEASTILALMARQLRNACPTPTALADTAVLLARAADPNPQELWQDAFSAEADGAGVRLQFVTTAGLYRHDAPLPRRVAYRYDSQTGTLFYHESSADRFALNGEPDIVLLDALDEVSLEYYDACTWRGTWRATQQNGLPQAVRLSLTGPRGHFATTVSLQRASRIMRDNTDDTLAAQIGGHP